MTFVPRAEPALDYHQCRYGASKLLFRGPRRKPEGRYVAVLGGAETYGRFVEQPFPAMIETALGKPVINLGYPNAGVDVFLNDETVIGLCRRAEATVVQVMGAQNLSNRFYSVHPRRNDRFLKASRILQGLFHDVDFTEFNFTRHMLAALEQRSPRHFAIVAEEVRLSWVARMRQLLGVVGGKRVLLWIADHAPGGPDDFDPRASDPLFVTKGMIDEIRPLVDEVVEVVPSVDARAHGTEGMILSPEDKSAAETLPGPAVHREVAEALGGTLGFLLG